MLNEVEQICDRVAIIDHGRVIAQGTPRELIASLGAAHVVEFEAANHLDRDALRSVEGVKDLLEEKEAVHLTVTEVHRAVPSLLAELERQGAPMTRLTTHHATLEDVFLALTGRHLRDG